MDTQGYQNVSEATYMDKKIIIQDNKFTST